MANIQELRLAIGRVVDGFLLPDPDEPDLNGKLLPSLRRLGWKICMRTTSNFWRQKISLTISEDAIIFVWVLKEIEGLVEEFVPDLVWDHDFPLDWCSISEEGEDQRRCCRGTRMATAAAERCGWLPISKWCELTSM